MPDFLSRIFDPVCPHCGKPLPDTEDLAQRFDWHEVSDDIFDEEEIECRECCKPYKLCVSREVSVDYHVLKVDKVEEK